MQYQLKSDFSVRKLSPTFCRIFIFSLFYFSLFLRCCFIQTKIQSTIRNFLLFSSDLFVSESHEKERFLLYVGGLTLSVLSKAQYTSELVKKFPHLWHAHTDRVEPALTTSGAVAHFSPIRYFELLFSINEGERLFCW